MAIVPDSNEAKINYFASKNTPWSANAVAIGTTTGAVTALATKVSTAQARLAAVTAAREASKNATAEFNAAVRDMAAAGADIIRQIRAKAGIDGDGVYFLAEIPAPATPSPVPAPGTPTAFTATLNTDGSLILKWKCANPAGAVGTMYQVCRRTGAEGQGGFEAIGGTGAKRFIDDTVPSGVPAVTYQITAMRSTAQGLPGEFTVNFGVSAGGSAMTASVAPRMAA